jgi:hypothetical protein
VGDLDFDPGTNPDVEPIWYENYVVDSTTNNVQVRYDSLNCGLYNYRKNG